MNHLHPFKLFLKIKQRRVHMFILGAGMTGCLAGIMNGGATILEAAPSLPNNHHGVLRFRTENISKITGIPFKKVRVYKSIWMDGQEQSLSPRLANLYSRKVTGKVLERSILNLETAERWIAPEDFHQQLGGMLKDRIDFSCKVAEIDASGIRLERGMHTYDRIGQPVISTLPMTVMARCTAIPFPSPTIVFDPAPIYVANAKVPGARVHQTIYYPGQETDIYRASMVGDILIIESMGGDLDDEDIEMVAMSFGIFQHPDVQFIHGLKKEAGKFAPIEDPARKSFMLKLSTELNIWSLGRYACWRPSVLMDDVYNDILRIRAMVGYHSYDVKRLL
jgi:hypothetical protein